MKVAVFVVGEVALHSVTFPANVPTVVIALTVTYLLNANVGD